MSKISRKTLHNPVGTGRQRLRWLLFAWFHLEASLGLTCAHCQQRPGAVRFDDYQPQPSLQELLSVPPEQAADRVLENLLKDQTAHGPRIHYSVLYCVECTVGHIDAIFPREPELAGLKAVVAMQEFAGHPGVALLHDTRTQTNALLISLERTPEGLFRQIARQYP